MLFTKTWMEFEHNMVGKHTTLTAARLSAQRRAFSSNCGGGAEMLSFLFCVSNISSLPLILLETCRSWVCMETPVFCSRKDCWTAPTSTKFTRETKRSMSKPEHTKKNHKWLQWFVNKIYIHYIRPQHYVINQRVWRDLIVFVCLIFSGCLCGRMLLTVSRHPCLAFHNDN